MGMITGIEEKRGICHVYVDGVLFSKVKKKYWEQMALAQGDELEKDSFHDRLSALQFKDAYEASLDLLTARDMTAQLLIAGLVRRGYTAAVAEAVRDRLSERGLINDERYAQRYMELHREDGVGRYALRRKLRGKGLSENLVEEALGQIDEAKELEAARALAGKLSRRYEGQDPRAIRSKVSQALSRRGYSWDTIAQAMDSDADEWQETP